MYSFVAQMGTQTHTHTHMHKQTHMAVVHNSFQHPDNYTWDKCHVLDVTPLQSFTCTSINQEIFKYKLANFFYCTNDFQMRTKAKQRYKDKAKKDN